MIGLTGSTGLKALVGVVNSDTPLSTERLQQIAKETKDFPTTRAAEEYAMATEILARRQADSLADKDGSGTDAEPDKDGSDTDEGEDE